MSYSQMSEPVVSRKSAVVQGNIPLLTQPHTAGIVGGYRDNKTMLQPNRGQIHPRSCKLLTDR